MRFRCELLVFLLCTIVLVNSELYQEDEAVQGMQTVDKERKQDIGNQLATEEQNLSPHPNPGGEEEISENIAEKDLHNWQQRKSVVKRHTKKRSRISRSRRNKQTNPDELDEKEKKMPRFPYWIFITLIPLVVTLIVFIGCFVFYKRAYNKAVIHNLEEKRKAQKERKRSREEQERRNAGLPMSALDMQLPMSDYAGFGTEFNLPKVKEGGIGSIMRDPDLDSAAREEAPRTYKMIFSGNEWKTVDEVPSNMSFEIPSESM